MKASKLIERLNFFVEKYGDLDVDLNDSRGTYEKIVDIKSTTWIDCRRNKHSVIELIHDGTYDPDDSLVDNLICQETINWCDIKPGDVVLEGNRDTKYRTLTNVDGTYWEYLDPNDGFYHNTSPEYCHYLVKDQKSAGRKLIKIEFNRSEGR